MKLRKVEPESSQELRSRAQSAVRQSRSEQGFGDGDAEGLELKVHEVELRMQNEALRELHLEAETSHERYRELFDCAPVAYVALDSESTVLDANLVAGLLLRREHYALVGKKLSTLIDPAHANLFVRHMRRTLSTNQRQSVELALILPDGTPCEVRLESARSRLDSGQWRSTLIDLSELRDLQRHAGRATRLETVGAIAARIAHDFSDLLGTMATDADLALAPAAAGLGTDPLERIKRGASRGQSMMRELLRFVSGPESAAALSRLDTSVRRSESMVRQVVGSNIELRMDLQAPEAEVCLDLGGPEEILLHLASNALHAMPRGGELLIETRTIAENAKVDPRLFSQDFALLTVRDSGRGMDAATQAKAFQPFFTTRTEERALGLGLAMVHGIVQRAGGHVELESDLERGTSVQIFLPLTNRRHD